MLKRESIIVLLFSGGAESLLSLHRLRAVTNCAKRIVLYHINYGQKAFVKEQQAGEYYSTKYSQVYYQYSNVTGIIGSLGTQAGIGPNHVYSRNLIFIGLALNYCLSNGFKTLILPFTDEPGKPQADSTRQYLAALRPAIKKAYPNMVVKSNLLNNDGVTHRLLMKDKVDLEMVWSCDNDGLLHCGQCEKCKAILNIPKIDAYVEAVGFKTTKR